MELTVRGCGVVDRGVSRRSQVNRADVHLGPLIRG